MNETNPIEVSRKFPASKIDSIGGFGMYNDKVLNNVEG
jgi:hypothetical protein